MVALALAACGPTPAPPAVEPLPEPAAPAVDPAVVAPIAELLSMEDRRHLDAPRWHELLRHADPVVRRWAIRSGARIGDPAAVPSTRLALHDADPVVRAEAAFALGLLRDTTAATATALAARIRRSAEADLDVLVEAIAALARIGTPAARRPVEAVLADPDAPAAATAEALLSIWRFPRQAHDVRLVRPHLDAPDPEIRWRAAYALMRLGDPVSADALLAAAGDEAPEVRALAVRALNPALADSAGRTAAARAALVAALDDAHPHVRINAARALPPYADSSLAEPLARRLDDPDPNVALAAAEALAQLAAAQPRARIALAVRLDAWSARPGLRPPHLGAALAGLFRADPRRGVERAGTAAASRDWIERLHAARSLAAAPWPTAAPLLRRLAADPDPRVAAAALDAAASIAGDSIEAAHALFVQHLGSRDILIRAAALRGIAARAEPADLAFVMDGYAHAASDPEPDAALAAIDALARLAEAGVPVGRAFYARFPRPADRRLHLRARARLGPGAWGDVDPPVADREPAFYERVVRDLVLPALAGEPGPRARFHTAGGTFTVELLPADAPLTVHNFVSLVRQAYYRGTRWHRVVPNFVLQDGDPRGDGSGGPGYAIRDEINRARYLRGVVGMALAGPDTGGSQFFVTHSPQPHLDGGYTVFGRVVSGMEVADRVVQDDPIPAIDIID